MENIRLIATDLDGTFLRNDKTISPLNLETLVKLGTRGIVRVAATGRNMLKVREVIPDHIPFDYVVYSSGSGVYSCIEKKHIHTQSISSATADRLASYFIGEEVNFHAFRPAPENHLHWFHRGSERCEEFERYYQGHYMHATPVPDSGNLKSELSQFLVVIPGDEKRFISLREKIESISSEIRVIRATSPLETGYIWLEIFHNTVSKANGVLYICNLLGIAPENTIGIGNDYNDIDLLEFTGLSFLTDNAPDELKKNFRLVPANEEDAFAHVVLNILTL